MTSWKGFALTVRLCLALARNQGGRGGGGRSGHRGISLTVGVKTTTCVPLSVVPLGLLAVMHPQ